MRSWRSWRSSTRCRDSALSSPRSSLSPRYHLPSHHAAQLGPRVRGGHRARALHRARAAGWVAERMKWVTRARVKVDRVACPWLIRRFIDPQAAFVFVPAGQVAEVASREGAKPYDVEGADLGHNGEECRFDAFVRRYQLEGDPALQRMRLIVRGADTDRTDLGPAAAGLKAVAHGLSALGHSDERLLELQFPIYDALYTHCGGGGPAGGGPASPP